MEVQERLKMHTPDFPIIVHSHLRWDGVWQRPQQFLSRLSGKHPILFIEQPLPWANDASPDIEVRRVEEYPNIFVARVGMAARGLQQRANIDFWQAKLVKDVLDGPLGDLFEYPVQWFYDPLAAEPFAGKMGEIAIVYDCMDELSQFRDAPRELIERERRLLAIADVVFAGGPKLFRSKRQQNSNCHCYGCGVDIAHFSKALLPETAAPRELEGMVGPILGFFGVVDERMDYELVAHLASSHPEWNVVIVGPHAKVNPRDFPHHQNLFWLGGRSYEELPAYAKCFDVCLMPFALNEATQFINPTKALEYMATATPIVSTAVEDVVAQFADVVQVAASPQEFVAHCERAIAAPDFNRIWTGLELAKNNSWEGIVQQLEARIVYMLRAKLKLQVCAA